METTNKISLTKKILIALGGILSCACVGFGVFHSVQNSSIEVHVENEVYRKKFNQKATYDDVAYTITLNPNELNDSTFTNFSEQLMNIYDEVASNDESFDTIILNLLYDSTTYSFEDADGNGENGIYFQYTNSTNKITFNIFEDSVDNFDRFYFNDEAFEFSLVIYLGADYYDDIKSAIELDIQGNIDVSTPSYVLYPINANNDTFTYLGGQIIDNISTIATSLANSYVVYRGVTYNFLNASNGSLTWQDSVSKDSINFGFQTHNDYPVNKFFYFNFTDTEVETFADIVYFYDAEFIADNITAPMNTGNFITDLIALLTGGITGTSTAMGVGLSSLVDALAIQNNAMSSFMSVIFAFGGIALSLALCRWIVNLLSSLGQRNR